MSKKPYFHATDEERELVEIAVAVGVVQDQLVHLIRRPTGPDGAMEGISLDTLQRHFHDEILVGKTRVMVKIAGRLTRAALGLDPRTSVLDEQRAAFFILKTRHDFRERDSTDNALPETDREESDAIAIAARVAGLLDLARRQKKGPGGESLN